MYLINVYGKHPCTLEINWLSTTSTLYVWHLLTTYLIPMQISSWSASVTVEIQYSTSSVITYVMSLSLVSKFILVNGIGANSNIATLLVSDILLEGLQKKTLYLYSSITCIVIYLFIICIHNSSLKWEKFF